MVLKLSQLTIHLLSTSCEPSSVPQILYPHGSQINSETTHRSVMELTSQRSRARVEKAEQRDQGWEWTSWGRKWEPRRWRHREYHYSCGGVYQLAALAVTERQTLNKSYWESGMWLSGRASA